jgi:DnaJ-class molecular chaperone
MYDLAQPNARPGTCEKCRGSGLYRWGAVMNGRAQFAGACHSCNGTGRQTLRDIRRNVAYNVHKIRTMGV